jgi:hypothetical protein
MSPLRRFDNTLKHDRHVPARTSLRCAESGRSDVSIPLASISRGWWRPVGILAHETKATRAFGFEARKLAPQPAPAAFPDKFEGSLFGSSRFTGQVPPPLVE